jgi:hypothetical protein
MGPRVRNIGNDEKLNLVLRHLRREIRGGGNGEVGGQPTEFSSKPSALGFTHRTMEVCVGSFPQRAAHCQNRASPCKSQGRQMPREEHLDVGSASALRSNMPVAPHPPPPNSFAIARPHGDSGE